MGTAGGDLHLSRALYLHRNLLRGWTLPLPFTGRDWPQQTLHPTPGGPCLEEGLRPRASPALSQPSPYWKSRPQRLRNAGALANPWLWFLQITFFF